MSALLLQELLVKFKQAEAIQDLTAFLSDIKELFKAKELNAVAQKDFYEVEVPEIIKDLPIVDKENQMPLSIKDIDEADNTESDVESNYFRRIELHSAKHNGLSSDKVSSKAADFARQMDKISLDIQKILNIHKHHGDAHASKSAAAAPAAMAGFPAGNPGNAAINHNPGVANGNAALGNAANGNVANGNVANGNVANGNVANGNVANGNVANGNVANGNVATGNVANGN
ncbi:MAG: pentapeptide repeat-containing protein, partial [Candidatus Berkiella sp.]